MTISLSLLWMVTMPLIFTPRLKVANALIAGRDVEVKASSAPEGLNQQGYTSCRWKPEISATCLMSYLNSPILTICDTLQARTRYKRDRLHNALVARATFFSGQTQPSMMAMNVPRNALQYTMAHSTVPSPSSSLLGQLMEFTEAGILDRRTLPSPGSFPLGQLHGVNRGCIALQFLWHCKFFRNPKANFLLKIFLQFGPHLSVLRQGQFLEEQVQLIIRKGVSHSHVFALPITVSWASMSRSRQCFKANYSPEENLGREGVWYEINRQVMILEHVVYVLFEI
ncbi:hypothetical protein NC651_028254 [Populus alba x Populus x berolinensis]|nr:hypothetical protein NC651_028254 [Populus alba x Populus x berolinensis]